MDKFDQAREKANNLLFEELNKEGYQELRHPVGSLFHTARQDGLPDKAIIITVHIDPDIGFAYKFRRMDSLDLQDLLERNYNLYCYHYYFNENLDEFKVEKKQVKSAYEILEFWETHDVTYETEQSNQMDEPG